jgi:anionic cell wall polymer biosynthesis LytR-Cps2A-Psr (LCP) family protein
MIDAAGGVVVDIQRPLRDDEYPNDDYSTRRIFLPAGLQWLDGERALWYARSRHQTNDFDRADRQQRLLLALKARARDPGLLPRVPSLMKTGAEAIRTDLSPRETLALASLAVKSDLRNVRGIVLTPPDYGRAIDRPDLYAIIPDRDRIRRAVAALLATDPNTPPAAAAPPDVRALPVLPVDERGGGVPDAPP